MVSLSRKKSAYPYTPGQEIYFSAGTFGWETDDEAVNVFRNRIMVIIGLFLLIYAVIVIRIFNVCLVDGIQLDREAISYYRPRTTAPTLLTETKSSLRPICQLSTFLPTPKK